MNSCQTNHLKDHIYGNQLVCGPHLERPPSLHVKKNKPVRGITCTRAASLQLYWWDHDIANS